MLNQSKFREEIITEGNWRNIMGNMMLNLLKDLNWEYEENTLQDFLNDRELFKKAKSEIYDILRKEDQKTLDVTDRILRWNSADTEEEIDEKYSENKQVIETMFDFFQPHKEIQKVRKIMEWDNGSMEGIYAWQQFLSAIQSFDSFKENNLQEQFSLENVREWDLYEKSQLIIKAAKLYMHSAWVHLLPEQWEGRQDTPSTNMNTISVYMWICLLDSKTLLNEFSPKSIYLITELDWQYLVPFLYHFNVTTPKQLNEFSDRFTKYIHQVRENWGLLEAHIEIEWGDYKDLPLNDYEDSEINYFIQFLTDSFGRVKDFTYSLQVYWINNIEDLEKLFPYWIVGNIAHLTRFWLKEKVHNFYDAMWIKDVEWLATFFQVVADNKLSEEELKKPENKDPKNFKKLKIIKLLSDEEPEYIKEIFDYIWLKEKYQHLSFLGHENFSKIIQIWIGETKRIWTLIGIKSLGERTQYINHKNLPKILSLGNRELNQVFDFMELKSTNEYRDFVYEEWFKDFATIYKEYWESLSDDSYHFDAWENKKEYVLESLELFSLKDYNNIKAFPEDEDISENNWMKALIWYWASNNPETYIWSKISNTYKELFEELEKQNIVYDQLHEIYKKIIQQEKINHKELAVLNTLQEYWVGNLSYTSLLVDISNCIRWLDAHKWNKDIIWDIYNNLINVESVMRNWSLTEQTNLYWNITSIINVDATIASDCLLIINWVSNKISKKFSKEILPIIVSRLYLIKWEWWYNPEDTKELTKYISDIIEMNKQWTFNQNTQESLRIEILKSMKDWIKKRFSIKEMPLESLVDNMWKIQKYLIYLANIHSKTEEKTAILWLYLWLQLNNKWNDFRTGKEIDYTEIFDENITWTLRSYFNTKKENDLFTEYSEKQKEVFQTDTSIQTLWTVQTIDSKLSAIHESLNDLLDEDNYETDDEKNMLSILLKHWKTVWWTLALLHQWKESLFKEQHILVKKDLEASYGSIDLASTISLLQHTASEVSPSINFANKVKAMGISDKIEKLNSMKLPNAELVKIFGKAWEKLSTSSWVIPIKNDIEYLSDILNTSKQLNDQERQKGLSFLNEISEYLQSLQKDFDRISSMYDNLAKTILAWDNDSLKWRIKDMNRIFDTSKQSNEQSFLTTKLTSDFDIIIPNIRGCLWCMKREINNDTNLTFGDSNKFFAAIFAEDPNRSIADCIVDVFPYSLGDNFDQKNSKNTFVIERVYWERTPDVLLSIVNVILKKKNESTISDIDILISNEAISSCWLRQWQVEEFLENEDCTILEVDNANINVSKSPSWDGYYEFAKWWWGRFSGEIKAWWILIR